MDYIFIDELKTKEKEVLYNFLKEFPTMEVREALNKIDNMQGQELIDCLNYLKKEVEDKKCCADETEKKPIIATTPSYYPPSFKPPYEVTCSSCSCTGGCKNVK